MNRIKINSTLLLLLMVFIFAISSCQKQEKVEKTKPLVICSIFPLFEFASEVAGNRADVSMLLPPGVEVHAWETRPSDVLALSKADAFVFIHESLEPWADDLLRGLKNSRLVVVKAAEHADLIRSTHNHNHGGKIHAEHQKIPKNQAGEGEHHQDEAKGNHGETGHDHRGVDPHIWLDFDTDQKIVEGIAAKLASIDEKNAEYYAANARSYQQKLQALDKKYREQLSRCRQKRFIYGGHAAFAYLARRYGLEQISLYGINPDSEPTPSKLAEIIDLAKNLKTKYIYFEVMVHPKLTEILAEDIGARTLTLTPGANLSKKQLESGVTFLDLMEENLINLKKGLGCE